mgnify:CR=1 FL=1
MQLYFIIWETRCHPAVLYKNGELDYESNGKEMCIQTTVLSIKHSFSQDGDYYDD